ncbi:hypothetical protein [Fodinicurvata halophila]|uniref:hypothetical protein n=1 Tax=Fodinicurvata halophila TaxID=1419723 RepID=UPI00363468ED
MSVNSYVWPHPQAVVDRLARFMDDHDEKLVITSPTILLPASNAHAPTLNTSPRPQPPCSPPWSSRGS